MSKTIRTLKELLIAGVTENGPIAVKLIDGVIGTTDEAATSGLTFPLICEYDGNEVTVAWNDEERELVVFDTTHGELEITDHLLSSTVLSSVIADGVTEVSDSLSSPRRACEGPAPRP